MTCSFLTPLFLVFPSQVKNYKQEKLPSIYLNPFSLCNILCTLYFIVHPTEETLKAKDKDETRPFSSKGFSATYTISEADKMAEKLAQAKKSGIAKRNNSGISDYFEENDANCEGRPSNKSLQLKAFRGFQGNDHTKVKTSEDACKEIIDDYLVPFHRSKTEMLLQDEVADSEDGEESIENQENVMEKTVKSSFTDKAIDERFMQRVNDGRVFDKSYDDFDDSVSQGSIVTEVLYICLDITGLIVQGRVALIMKRFIVGKISNDVSSTFSALKY